MADSTNQRAKQSNYMAFGIGMGVAIGTAVGAATDEVAVGLGLGIGFGVALAQGLNVWRRKAGRNKPDQ